MLQELKDIRMKARKSGDKSLASTASIIIGEAQRNPDKEKINEDFIYKIIDSLIKEEQSLLSKLGKKESEYLKNLLKFQRPKVSYDNMIHYFSKIDFSKLQNKFQAIKMLKDEFGEKNVDGDKAKQILIDMD